MPKEKLEKVKKKVVVVEEVQPVEESPSVENIETKVEVQKEEVSNAPKVEAVSQEQIQEQVEEYDEKPNYLWIIIPTALLVGALVGGLITYFSGVSSLNSLSATPSPQATTMPTVEETPAASPSSSLKRDAVTVQILNGSGVSGAAGTAKTLLVGLGYKTVDTGNASSSSVATTEVAIKDSKKEYLDLIMNDLSKDYEAVEATKALAETSKYDIVITIGKK